MSQEFEIEIIEHKDGTYFSYIWNEVENSVIYVSADYETKREAWEQAIKNIPMPDEYNKGV